MTLAEKVAKIKESELYKLVFEGKVLGLRVKFFDSNTDTMLYYDFELDTVRENKGVVHFVNSIKETMASIQLHRNGSGLLVSDDEEKLGIIIQEFENEADAVRILEPLSKIYHLKSEEVSE